MNAKLIECTQLARREMPGEISQERIRWPSLSERARIMTQEMKLELETVPF